MIGRTLDCLADLIYLYATQGRAGVLSVVHEACARSHCPAAHRIADALEKREAGRG